MKRKKEVKKECGSDKHSGEGRTQAQRTEEK